MPAVMDLDKLDRRGSPAAIERVRAARTRPVRRARLVVGGLSVVLLGVFAARVLLGDFTFTIPDFFRILFGEEIPGASFILMESKLPRAVLGVLVGVAFGVGGAIFQTTLRNPLASPDIIGVSAGRQRGRGVRDRHPRPARRLGVGGRDRRCGRHRPGGPRSSPGRAPATAWC